MWRDLESLLGRFAGWFQSTPAQRRASQTRARFWAGVREGELEAERAEADRAEGRNRPATKERR